jgi:hypothetical protein
VFGRRSLWLAWFAGGVQMPIVIPVDDVPDVPYPRLVSGVLDLNAVVCEQEIDGTGHLAMALCRPGRAAITEDDVEWGAILHESLDDQLDGSWSLHLAAGGRVTPIVDAPGWVWPAREASDDPDA